MSTDINVTNDASMGTILSDAKEHFNELFSNMLKFTDSDMEMYDKCYRNVFGQGMPSFSFMSSTFYAQFAPELLIGILSSNPLRRFIVDALDNEAKYTGEATYWNSTMPERRFGIPGRDYTQDMNDIVFMMQDSYGKISALNKWYGLPEGVEEFEMYCLSHRAVDDIKRIVLEFPYLIRRYDHDRAFAEEIMEYAGIVAVQIQKAMSEG